MSAQTLHCTRGAWLALALSPLLFAGNGIAAFPRTHHEPAVPAGRNLTFAQPGAFVPAGVVSASDTQFPLQVLADGIVVFNVALNAQGKITKISTLSGVPGLTDVARSSLHSWKFRPASIDGTHQASEMLVAFVFRHAVKTWNPPPFIPVPPSNADSGSAAAGISSAVYSEYPISTIAGGAVVLQVGVRPDGSTGNIKVVRPMAGGFVKLATQAARQWTFQAATTDSAAVPSSVAIAFVFSSRSLNPF